ncbi:antibiotic biosynthesis monooxygenase [Oxalobacteraceae bacterium]|nr:antibiotic biosynthesis monooxygenase [Oxalobacteraceae bacterium]
MFYEIVTIQVKPDTHADFEAAIAKAVPLFQRSRGCQSLRLERSVEQPDTYKIVIGWATLEDHTTHFVASEEVQEFRRLAGGFVAAPTHMEHVQIVLNGF